MDDLFSKITSFYSRQNHEELASYLRSKSKLLKDQHTKLEQLYNAFQGPEATLVQISIFKKRLSTLTQVSMNDWEKWLQRISTFLINFDPLQAQFNKKSFCGLCFKYAHYSFELGVNYPEFANRAFCSLLNAYHRIGLYGKVTPIHTALCKLALKTKQISAVRSIIEEHYLSIDAQETGIKAEQAILFFYYAGSIATVLKRYDIAAHFFELGITTPSQAVHAASIECYKKLVLITIIVTGNEYSHPKYVSPPVHKMINILCGAYSKLASTFHDILVDQQIPEALTKIIVEAGALWSTDSNYGLIKQVQKALIKHKIKRLTKTYVTLSFADISAATGIRECEEMLVDMIIDGELNAKIDQEHKMIIFEEKDNQLNIDDLETDCHTLLNQLREVENMIEVVSLDPRYARSVLPTMEKKSSSIMA